MGVYPYAQELYETVMGDNPSRFKATKKPVKKASWCDAI